MSQGLASAGGSFRRSYGATSDTPEVVYAGGGNSGEGQFSPTEMYDLSENITSNIYTINASWKQLEYTMKVVGSAKDSVSLREDVHVTQSKSNQIISQTTRDLHRLTSIVRKGDKQQKLQVDKLTGSFKEAVQKYSKIQKQLAEKMKCHMLPTPQENVQSDDDANRTSSSEKEHQMMVKQKLITKELEFNQGMLIEWEQRVKTIEDDILDVNQIMRELAAMVYAQSEPINSIENSIETTYSNVESGNELLEKASSYQNKQRKTTGFLIGISVIIGVILTIVLSVSLH